MPDNDNVVTATTQEEKAQLTNLTYLLIKDDTTSKYSKLVDITSYPQIGGEPEQVDVTTMSDTKHRYINGLEDTERLEFGANYRKSDYSKLNTISAADAVRTYSLCFGDMLGTDGRFEWSGRLSLYLSAGESGAARGMSFTISDEGKEAIHEVEPLTNADIAE